MSADRGSAKVAHTFYPYGYYNKFRDAGWQSKADQQQEPGRADAFLIPIGQPSDASIFIEAKRSATTTRYNFDQWNERQRLFAVACEASKIPYWIFLMMGENVSSLERPLQAFLLTAEDMFEIEWLAGNRRSLGYETALSLLLPLNWVKGEDRWDIPKSHPFRNVLRRGHHGRHSGIRDSALRGNSQG